MTGDSKMDLVKLATGGLGRLATLGIEVRGEESDPDLLTITASDASLDRDQEILEPAGWRLENYLKNPVIQNSHQYGDILFTIGRAEKTWVEGGRLKQVWRFASAANPMARIARDLYRGGFLRSCSVGFRPVRWEYGAEGSGYYRKFLEQELLEVSAVAVPANPNALVAGVKSGAIARPDLEELQSLLIQLSAALQRQPGPSAPQGHVGHAQLNQTINLAKTVRLLLGAAKQ
jgi:hypothetical protein